MIHLKEINLSEVEKQKQKVMRIREELKKEEDKLRSSLVALNLDYYGTSPSNYYKSIEKNYVTEDGYSVMIENGTITISKKIQKNLTMIWMESFNPDTTFCVSRSTFKYDSNRYIESTIVKNEIAEKHKDEIARFQQILQEEQIFDPFSEYTKFYSFLDFHVQK